MVEPAQTLIATDGGRPRSWLDLAVAPAPPPRPGPRLPFLFITSEFGLAGALQVAWLAGVDVQTAPRWDEAMCVAAARAWPVILLDAAAPALPLNQALAVLRRSAPDSRLLCLLPAGASEAVAAHAAGADGVLRKPLDVNAVRWHVHQLLGSPALAGDLRGWNRHVNNVFAYVSEHYHEPVRVVWPRASPARWRC